MGIKTRLAICFHLIFIIWNSHLVFAQMERLKAFPLSSVGLLDGPFKEAQQTDLQYILALVPDRLLAPFLREAGIKPLAESYGNWENTGLDGHIGGHYLSALSGMYAATGNKELLNRLNYMLNWLQKCQQANGNGYVGGVPGSKDLWQEIAAGKIKAGAFSLNDRWVPLYNIHKLYAGLIDAYRLAGSEQAKEILVPLAGWFIQVTSGLSDTQMQDMLRSEHGGLNEVFADVADITGDQHYLALARRLSHHQILDPLLEKRDELSGLHANTQIPKVIGFMRVAELSDDKAWADAADLFWNTVVTNRTISIGGNSVREHFNPANDFSSMIESREGPETCNSYNMLKLSRLLFLSHPDARYLDYYERTVYNHILSSQHPGGGFVYFTPIRPQHYRVYSQPQESFWCCVGSGLENHGKYGELIYAHNNKDLYVNLYIPSQLSWKERGLLLTQTTVFPYEEKTEIKLDLKKPARFVVKFRYPAWLGEGEMVVLVNNRPVKVTKDRYSYASVERKWRSGDVIRISLPMHTRAEALPDKSQWLSFVHGPVVLAAVTDSADLTGLKADGTRMGHIASGRLYPLDDAPLLVSDSDDPGSLVKAVADKPLTFHASELIWQDRFKDLKLVPFYTVHDARYVVYWPYTSKAKLPEIRNAMKEKEEAKLKLEAMTIDLVMPGEQQPESDHRFKGEDTGSGLFRERHFRNAHGWFAYDLKDPDNQATVLRITCHGTEKNKGFHVYINDIHIAEVTLDGSEGDAFFDVDTKLPETLTKSKPEVLRVKFVAKEGMSTGNIYEVRLIR